MLAQEPLTVTLAIPTAIKRGRLQIPAVCVLASSIISLHVTMAYNDSVDINSARHGKFIEIKQCYEQEI